MATWVILGGLVVAVLLARKAGAMSGGRRVDEATMREMEELIRERLEAAPAIPTHFALACAELESGFDPNSSRRNGVEQSYGLFNVNWNAHESRAVGMGATGPTSLYDPTLNCDVWISIVKDLLQIVNRENPNLDGTIGGFAKRWQLVRLGLGSLTTMRNPEGATARAMLARFTPVWSRWRSIESESIPVGAESVESDSTYQTTVEPLSDGGRRDGAAPRE